MIKADKTANGQTNRWTKQKAAEPTDKKTNRQENPQMDKPADKQQPTNNKRQQKV